MFPNIVTVFNVIKSKDSITYHRQIVKDVFFNKDKIISQEGKGEKYASVYNVIFSNVALKKWVNKQEFSGEEGTYTLRENDIIVLGEYNNISDLSDLQKSNADYFLIKTVSENLYGEEDLQNIEVTN